MKRFYQFLVLTLFALPGWAQSNAPTNDAQATKILNEVSAKFKTFKSVKANFSYKVENANGKNLSTNTGTVFMKGNKYKVVFAGQEIFSDGKTVWSYEKGSNEVTISTIDESSNMMTPQKLFTNFYDKDFLSLYRGEKMVSGKMVQEIEMTPTDKSKSFHKLYLLVDKKAKTVFGTRVLEKSGNKYIYQVSNFTPNATIPDATFVFDKKNYPGVEEVDLR